MSGLTERASAMGQGLISFFLPRRSRLPGYDSREVTRELGYIRATLVIFAGLVVISVLTAFGVGQGMDIVSWLWALYAVILLSNLLAVKLTGRFFLVTSVTNWTGLLLMGPLLYYSGGVQSPYAPLFLVGITLTGNFGGLRSILALLSGFLVMVVIQYVLQSVLPDAPADLEVHFAFLFTAGLLAMVGNMSAQITRSRARQQLSRAIVMSERRRLESEVTRAAVEATLDQLRDTQAQLVLQEKMASLGGLVAGVAHEVNTPVGLAVTGASQLTVETTRIRAMVSEGRLRKSDFEDYVATVAELGRLIEHNASRAASLIQSFKEVAVDQSSGSRRPFELDRYVGEVIASLGPQLKRGGHAIEVTVPGDILMDGYPGPFAQVLTNLVMNSLMHAFEPGRPGVIRVTARSLPEDRIELRYSDNGRGIPRDLWSRIFEPFFTTKRGSGGSGLGLHLVWNIVTVTMGGRLEVGDALGGGACFTLQFPRVSPRSPEHFANLPVDSEPG
jgi:signal transduction histidine kinase